VIVGHLERARRPRPARVGERAAVRLSWAAHVLREQGMPVPECHAVFGTDDPRTLRRYMDLHRERLEERLMDQRAVLECIEVLLTETIRTRSTHTATRSIDEATGALHPAPDGAFAEEA
jgi:hypothetical protein